MRETSLLYQKEIRAVQRADASARIRLGLMDLDAVTTVTQLSGSSDADFSRIASSVYEDGVPQKVYATFEPGRMMADGVLHDLHKLKCAGKECACVRVESEVKGAGEDGANGVGR